jgi:hypothetical protein
MKVNGGTSFVRKYTPLATKATALIRFGFSLGLVGAPEMMTKPWAGEAASDPAVKHLNRTYGALDLVLGAGTFEAMSGPKRVAKRWVQASAVADAVDAVSMLFAFKSVPRNAAVAAVVVSTASALFGFFASSTLDEPGESA